jgi:hypothetical protein
MSVICRALSTVALAPRDNPVIAVASAVPTRSPAARKIQNWRNSSKMLDKCRLIAFAPKRRAGKICRENFAASANPADQSANGIELTERLENRATAEVRPPERWTASRCD